MARAGEGYCLKGCGKKCLTRSGICKSCRAYVCKGCGEKKYWIASPEQAYCNDCKSLDEKLKNPFEKRFASIIGYSI